MEKRNSFRKTSLPIVIVIIAVFLILPAFGCGGHTRTENTPAPEAVSGNTAPGRLLTKEPRNPSASGAVPGSTAAAEPPKKETVPDFVVKDADGEDARLSDFFGKPIILNFWAVWCPPCRGELPAFEQMYKAYGDRVCFLMVSVDSGGNAVDGVKHFIADMGYTFPVYFDTANSAAFAYDVSAIPASFFIDAGGCLVSAHSGAMSADRLEKEISRLFPQR